MLWRADHERAGRAIAELKMDVPGRYMLGDRALSRLERGLVGFLIAEGDPNPEIDEPQDMDAAEARCGLALEVRWMVQPASELCARP